MVKNQKNTVIESCYTTMASPYGEVTIQACEKGLLGVWFATYTTKPEDLGEYIESERLTEQVGDDGKLVLARALSQLKEYFNGELTRFALPLAATGTEFQQKVWHVLTTIPYGETWSYQDLANAIDNPKAVRAVGLANGKNPISIIVPCHRVIGKNGKLTGYAGGIECKKGLLEAEARYQKK
ncbi:Methylated-DNA--protein-cysteine methyltransferase [Vibrio casei]|nr:Methylated-DNA--protein-cysteine methyltransferase [Vibrio casei]